MNLRQFHYFVGVVDAGSFSRAALSLGVAQPALSLQISNLEQELGTALLVRSQRGVQPTSAGNHFYRSARAVLNEIHQVRQTIVAGDGLAGDVSLGLTTSFSAFFAGPIAAATLKRHPNVRLRIFDSPGHLHEQSLLRGTIDVALLSEDAAATGLKRKHLYRQALFLIERRKRGEHSIGEVRLRDLVGKPLVLPTVPNPTRTLVERAFLAQGRTPHVVAEANSMQTLLSLVEAGAGGAIIAWGANEKHNLKWLKIIDPMICHDVSLCNARHLPHSECAAAVMEIVHELVMATVQSPRWQGANITPARR
jgi:LysR family nitrogen assimilation transcriptional regulator